MRVTVLKYKQNCSYEKKDDNNKHMTTSNRGKYTGEKQGGNSAASNNKFLRGKVGREEIYSGIKSPTELHPKMNSTPMRT